MDLYGKEVLKGSLYTPCFNSAYYEPKGVGTEDNKENIILPKEIVETWEPVYKEVEVKLTIGNPAKEIIIRKDSVSWEDTTFIMKDVEALQILFISRHIGGDIYAHINKIWIGCDRGSEFTKEELLKVIKTAEEL